MNGLTFVVLEAEALQPGGAPDNSAVAVTS